MIPQPYIDLLIELGTDERAHIGGSLFKHLKGTYLLLEEWGNPQSVCAAGLFHSIYGTDIYKDKSAGLHQRDSIAKMIGKEAEHLAYLFCSTNRTDYFKPSATQELVLVNRLTKEVMRIDESTLRALIEIETANYIDQSGPFLTSDYVLNFMRDPILRVGQSFMSAKARDSLIQLLARTDGLGSRLARQPVNLIWKAVIGWKRRKVGKAPVSA